MGTKVESKIKTFKSENILSENIIVEVHNSTRKDGFKTLLEAKLRKGQTPIFFNRDFESFDSDSNVNTELQLSETNQLTTEENNYEENNCINCCSCVIQ